MENTVKNWFKIISVQLLLGVISFFVFKEFFPAPVKKVVPELKAYVTIRAEIELPKEEIINYRLLAATDTIEWLSKLEKDNDTLNALMFINRIDGWQLKKLDTIIFPDTISSDINLYAPFPKKMEELKDVKKILFISHYVQAFVVYENGELIKWGPVNLGTKIKPTPTGLFAVNWKAKRTISTINPSWILDWYCNIDNFEGIGMHQYAMPGYPASHGCARMYRDDANWIYHWADQWKIKDGQIDAYGTPVVIFGEYPYGEQKPWITHSSDKNGLKISSEELNKVTNEYLPTILERQAKRDSVVMNHAIADR